MSLVLRSWSPVKVEVKYQGDIFFFEKWLLHAAICVSHLVVYSPTGTFYQHVISPTYDKVCKRKMATCHCEVCDSDMGSGYGGDHGYSGSGMSGSGYEGTGMGNMGDEKGNTEDGMSGEGDGGSGSGSGSGFGEKLGNLGDNLPLKKRK